MTHDTFSLIPTRDYMLGMPWLCEISRTEGLRIVHRDTRVCAWSDDRLPELDDLGRVIGHRAPYLTMLMVARELNHPGTVSPAKRCLAVSN